MGTIGFLVLAGMGFGVALGAITPDELARSSERSGRAGGFAGIFRWMIGTLGAIPAGLIIVALGLGVLVAMWLSVIRADRA